ncbi:MAG: hypothetical protein H0X45_09135 [Planctomycetes bacterium]|nr:hypothetical protein [Planctomycetota bacterium]
MILAPEHLARLRICATIVAAKGADSPYVADCVVRAYQGRHLSDLCRDLGWTCGDGDVVTIMGGIGTLRLAYHGNRFEPVVTTRSPSVPQPRPADDAMREQREALCRRCENLVDGRCRLAGCGCAGLGRPDRRYSRCPIGSW